MNSLESSEDVQLALTRVGELLEDAGEAHSIAIIGGAALLLSGLKQRATRDVDILATGSPDELRRPPDPLPEALIRATRTVARDQHLDPDWLNAEAGRQWITGIPDGWAGRLTWRRFGGLSVGITARIDLIFLKVFAATGATRATDKHYQDLLDLAPRAGELSAAAAWAETQGAGSGFHRELRTLIDHAKRDLGQIDR